MAKNINNAAGYGNTKEIERFLREGIDVDFEDEFGDAPLARAAFYGHLEAVKFLIDQGADIHHKSQNGSTALHLASSQGSTEIISFLISSGANLEACCNSGETHIMRSAINAHLINVKELVKAGASLTAQDVNGFNVLMQAMLIDSGPYKDRVEVIQFLLDQGADPLQKDNEGRNAIQFAEDTGRDHELISLLKKFAGIEETESPWHMVGGDDCKICAGLKKWKPSKRHPDYICPADVEVWIGNSLPQRVADASGTFYRGKFLIKLEVLQQWHSELCDNA